MEVDPSNPSVEEQGVSGGFISEFIAEITSSPVNLGLVLAIIFLIYKILKGRREDATDYPAPPPPMPKMKKQDFRIEELRKYDGTHESGRILVAVNGKVFDVTRGKRFYGPDGPYGSFAGHDASRALAMFQTDLVKDEHDDLSDLNSMQMESVKEWEAQLAEKYDFVGKLLAPGEHPSNYSEDEDGADTSEAKEAPSSNEGSPASKKEN